MIVASSTRELGETLNRLHYILGISAVVAAVAAAILLRRALRPLAELSSAAAEIERSGDATRRVPAPDTKDEVGACRRTAAILGSGHRFSASVAALLTAALIAACAFAAWPASSPLTASVGRAGLDQRWRTLYVACLIAAFTCYLAGLFLLRRHGSRLRLVAALAVAIQLIPLGAPLLLSTDAWSYWDYGRIAAVDGGNPYRDPPDTFPADPAYPFAGHAWRDTTSVYGPVFTLASEPIGRAVGASANAAAWTYKALAALAVLVAAALAAHLARRKAFTLAFVGWNPLLALNFAGGGHNDAWVAAVVLAALALAASNRRRLASIAWAVAIFVKWFPLLLLPLHALERRDGKRRFDAATFAAAVLLIAGMATWRYGVSWSSAFTPLRRAAAHGSHFALPHRLTGLGLGRHLALAVVGVACAAAYARLARGAWRGHARLGLAAGVILLAAPYLASWYTVWAVPLAAAEEDPAAQVLSLGLCAYLLRQGVTR